MRVSVCVYVCLYVTLFFEFFLCHNNDFILKKQKTTKWPKILFLFSTKFLSGEVNKNIRAYDGDEGWCETKVYPATHYTKSVIDH